MTVTALDPGTIIGGIDTHADTIHVAAIDPWGRELDDQEFATTPAGYQQALQFLTDLGEVTGVGIEGTSSYGVGVTRAARDAGLEVFEVIRPERAVRRREGKSDPLDAYQAAQVRMRNHPPTKAFVHQQRDRGRSTPEILRILKRAIAREMFKQLTRPHDVQDLRPTRQAKNITLEAAAAALRLAPMTISRTERGRFVSPEVVTATASGSRPLDHT